MKNGKICATVIVLQAEIEIKIHKILMKRTEMGLKPPGISHILYFT
jgi:hypothetical protein